ncbi:Hvo_1808 family surface protein [Haloarcula onubensis]|uniref:Hvo_1808 family surface protein n=1 Tax=Haloarcula onubensis TaxID=2950539 RepID=A0ABU2FMG3_9EURY|nr:Hvo_1808 family surface protein [Halomicroarcula sp. S3CR25-11]MDS0281950.1 Hvo_1808 family surface protein [Halomicroarcula sp. S3CR25-11]
MRRRHLLAVALVLVAALAGCSLPFLGHPEEPPGGDTIGWENGYWYDDPVDVTTSDGLNESEREAVTARTMARIERIRDREFTATVPVEVISRAEYRNRSRSNGSVGPGGNPWNDQVWESLLLVGESEGSDEAISDTRSDSVLGYYSSTRDRIVVVSESETPVVDRGTLAHELVHALQDQQFGLDGSPETQDTQLSHDGVIEGEANLVQNTYEQRCENRWSCISTPDDGGGGGGGGGGGNPGVFTVIVQPYVSGPAFVDSVYDEGGWDAVDALHEDYPASTEQVIHPERYPDERPVSVTVADRSNAEWDRFDRDPVGDTVGEASIFATMYHNGQTDADRYSYRSTPSEGWAGDRVVPYRDGSGGGGYVWESRWDTERDAREFAVAYRGALVEAHDARNPRAAVYVVPDGPFADAFRVVREGRTVRVVNGPTVDDLDGIHRSVG